MTCLTKSRVETPTYRQQTTISKTISLCEVKSYEADGWQVKPQVGSKAHAVASKTFDDEVVYGVPV